MLSFAVVAGLMGLRFQAHAAGSLDPQMFFALNRFYSDPIMGRAKPVSSDPIMGVVKNEAASDPIMGKVSSPPIMGRSLAASDPIMGQVKTLSSDPIMGKTMSPPIMGRVNVASSDPIMGNAKDEVASDPIMVPAEEGASDLQVDEMDNAVNTLLADSNMYQVLKTVLKSDPIMIKHLNLVLSDPQMVDTLKENLLSDPQL
jgi:hypothetical protein